MGAGVCSPHPVRQQRDTNVHVHIVQHAQLVVPGTPQPTEGHYTHLGSAVSPQLVMEEIPSGHMWRSVCRILGSAKLILTITPSIYWFPECSEGMICQMRGVKERKENRQDHWGNGQMNL